MSVLLPSHSPVPSNGQQTLRVSVNEPECVSGQRRRPGPAVLNPALAGREGGRGGVLGPHSTSPGSWTSEAPCQALGAQHR